MFITELDHSDHPFQEGCKLKLQKILILNISTLATFFYKIE